LEEVFFLCVAEEADEDELDCGWYENAGADTASRAAATARHFMILFIEVTPLHPLSRSQNQ
jgi:hypothetical protein